MIRKQVSGPLLIFKQMQSLFPCYPEKHFFDEVSVMEALMIKSLLNPVKEAHLRAFGPTEKFFEGTIRLLQGAHIFGTAFEEFAVVAKKEATWARSYCDLFKQIKRELDRTRAEHCKKVTGLSTVSKLRLQQLEVSGTNLESA